MAGAEDTAGAEDMGAPHFLQNSASGQPTKPHWAHFALFMRRTPWELKLIFANLARSETQFKVAGLSGWLRLCSRKTIGAGSPGFMIGIGGRDGQQDSPGGRF